MVRKPSPDAHRRKAGGRAEQRIVRVLREGVTEGEYLAIWDQGSRGHVRLVTDDDPISDPLTLVRRAAELQKASKKRERGEGVALFDEIWCVFDRDEHQNLDAALNMARDRGDGVAYSNQCFELWLVLHCEDQTAAIHRHDVQRRARELGIVDGKHLTEHGLSCCAGSAAQASARAKALDAKHEGDGSPPGSNPSSSMWRLIEQLARRP